MVGAGNPQRVFAMHTCAAHKNILNGIVEHVTHVEHTGHVWRRYDYSIGLTAVGLAVEQFVLEPVGIPFVLYLGGIVFLGKLVHCISYFDVQIYGKNPVF